MRVRDLLDQMHHEEFIVEISDLIHRQLVTSSLNGNFRNVLERRLRVRTLFFYNAIMTTNESFASLEHDGFNWIANI